MFNTIILSVENIRILMVKYLVMGKANHVNPEWCEEIEKINNSDPNTRNLNLDLDNVKVF